MTDEAMSPLRRRMIEDMTIRKLAPKTQHDYVQRVKNFAAFLGRSPDTASFVQFGPQDAKGGMLSVTGTAAGQTLTGSVQINGTPAGPLGAQLRYEYAPEA